LGGSFDQLFQLWFHRKSAFEEVVEVFYSKKERKLHIQILGSGCKGCPQSFAKP